MITSFPRPTAKTLAAALSTTETEIKRLSCYALLTLSRPRLAVSMAKASWGGADLDDSISAAARDLFNWKGRRIREGRGQWYSLEPTGVILDGLDDTLSSRLITMHMALVYFIPARIIGPQLGELRRQGDFYVREVKSTPPSTRLELDLGHKVFTTSPFKHRSGYPTVTEDPLLPMVLHGTKSVAAFADASEVRLSIRRWRIVDAIDVNNPFSADSSYDHRNPASLKRNGDNMEGITLAAAAISSHNEGVDGSCVDTFTSNFIKEFVADAVYPAHVSVTAVSTLFDEEGEDIGDRVVPYLFAAGAGGVDECALPECLQGLGHFAQLFRPKDWEMFDLKLLWPKWTDEETYNSCVDITGECKNHKHALDAKLLNDCMVRIPELSRLHFIVCASISKGCYDKRTDVVFPRYSTAQRKERKKGEPSEARRCKIVIASRVSQSEIELSHISKTFADAWSTQSEPVDTVVVIICPHNLAWGVQSQTEVAQFWSTR